MKPFSITKPCGRSEARSSGHAINPLGVLRDEERRRQRE